MFSPPPSQNPSTSYPPSPSILPNTSNKTQLPPITAAETFWNIPELRLELCRRPELGRADLARMMVLEKKSVLEVIKGLYDEVPMVDMKEYMEERGCAEVRIQLHLSAVRKITIRRENELSEREQACCTAGLYGIHSNLVHITMQIGTRAANGEYQQSVDIRRCFGSTNTVGIIGKRVGCFSENFGPIEVIDDHNNYGPQLLFRDVTKCPWLCMLHLVDGAHPTVGGQKISTIEGFDPDYLRLVMISFRSGASIGGGLHTVEEATLLRRSRTLHAAGLEEPGKLKAIIIRDLPRWADLAVFATCQRLQVVDVQLGQHLNTENTHGLTVDCLWRLAKHGALPLLRKVALELPSMQRQDDFPVAVHEQLSIDFDAAVHTSFPRLTNFTLRVALDAASKETREQVVRYITGWFSRCRNLKVAIDTQDQIGREMTDAIAAEQARSVAEERVVRPMSQGWRLMTSS